MEILGYPRAFLLTKVSDKECPLRYVVDKKSKMMKFEGSELISYFNLKE